MSTIQTDLPESQRWALEWQELVDSVGRFGLSERESMLYLSLIRRGRATARELSKDARIDRVLGYRMLDALCARGIIEITAERPRRYTPVAPDAFFDRSLRERRVALARDEVLARMLAERLPTLANESRMEPPRFQVLTGTSAAYDYLREMVGRAREDVAVMITHRALRESVDAGLPRWVLEFLRRGGRFRFVVESDPRVQGLIARFGPFLRRFPRAEIRQLLPQTMRMTIVDHAEAMVFLVPEARVRSVEEIAVWTNNSDFVQGQLHHFNVVWDMAGSGSLRPTGSPPRSYRPTPATAGSSGTSKRKV